MNIVSLLIPIQGNLKIEDSSDPDLVKSSIFHSVGVVMVINDFKVFNSISFDSGFKLNFWFSLSSSLSVNGEMGWGAHLNT